MYRVDAPQLAASMDGGVLGAWLKSVGDKVDFGDELCEVHVDEVTRMDRRVSPRALSSRAAKTSYRKSKGGVLVRFLVLAMESGILERIVVPAGERVTTGDALAVIGTGAADRPEMSLSDLPPARVRVERAATAVGS